MTPTSCHSKASQQTNQYNTPTSIFRPLKLITAKQAAYLMRNFPIGSSQNGTALKHFWLFLMWLLYSCWEGSFYGNNNRFFWAKKQKAKQHGEGKGVLVIGLSDVNTKRRQGLCSCLLHLLSPRQQSGPTATRDSTFAFYLGFYLGPERFRESRHPPRVILKE